MTGDGSLLHFKCDREPSPVMVPSPPDRILEKLHKNGMYKLYRVTKYVFT